MNEQAAREVVLARALETTDRRHELLSEQDRRQASSSARELAQWQASQARSKASADDFLHLRAGQLLKQVAERHPAFPSFSKAAGYFNFFGAGLPVLALLAGMFLDRITDPHRVDLLSAPLLLLIGWNLAVYAGMLLWPWLPFARWKNRPEPTSAWARLLTPGIAHLPRQLPAALVTALLAFTTQWLQLSRRLLLARLARTMHLGAALFALGAAASLVARGYLSQYSAGWESTFLHAGQVHALLSALFAPALAVLPLQGFSVAEIEALRFGQSPVPTIGGARWVQLYAATLCLLVVLPRLLLAGISHWRVRQWQRNFPLDLEQPYFRKLLNTLGGAPGALCVLPYSFAVNEARRQGLDHLASELLGEQARLLLCPPLAYGASPQDALRELAPNDGQATVTAVLFSLAATPENENHGALLDLLAARSARGIAVLVDESGYLERLGAQAGGPARMAERIALWRQFCGFHQASATFVNLLDPAAHPLDSGAALALSSAP